MGTKLDETVDRLGTIVERMESVFKGVVAQADGETPAPLAPVPAPVPAPEAEEDDET